MSPFRLVLALTIVMGATGIARAQDVPTDKPAPPSTGLPAAVDWKFNLDAAWGGFGFGNSLFTDPKEGVVQNFGQRWMEGFVKPSLTATHTLKSSSELYGKLSVAGERTYATPPSLVGPVESSFLPEDLSI